MRHRVGAIVLAVLVAAGCAGGGVPSPASAGAGSATPAVADLTIFAAASLAGVMERVDVAYESAVPGSALTISTDSSAALATQIEQGAPADVFLAADTTNPQKLVDAGLAAGEPIVFAGNALTVIVPRGDPAGIASPADLARDGMRIVAAGDEVPITRYASQLLANLAREPAYPPDFAQRYAANVVSKEDNVKAVVAKIGLGEGDAAIVYRTDAMASADVETIELPDSAEVRASYAGVVVKASRHVEAASRFLAWFAGADGQAILDEFGFLPPPG